MNMRHTLGVILMSAALAVSGPVLAEIAPQQNAPVQAADCTADASPLTLEEFDARADCPTEATAQMQQLAACYDGGHGVRCFHQFMMWTVCTFFYDRCVQQKP